MTNAHIETSAASGASGRLLARLARRGVVVCLLACAGTGAAQAQYHGQRDDAQPPRPPSARGERLALPPQIEQPRERMYDQQRDQQQRDQQQREQRRQAVQEMQQEGARDGGRRGGRLTPDERRELRRQVNEAGMDIYPGRGRR